MSAAFSDGWWIILSRIGRMAAEWRHCYGLTSSCPGNIICLIYNWEVYKVMKSICLSSPARKHVVYQAKSIDTIRDSSSPRSSASIVRLLKSHLRAGAWISKLWSVVLRLEDNSNQHHTVQHPLIDILNNILCNLRLHELSSIDSIWFHSEHWRMSVTAELLQSLWEWRCENLSLATAIKLHHSCDALIFLNETWCIHDQIEDQCLTTPVKAFTPSCIQSPAHLISMADQYRFTPETYIFDLMKLSDSRYGRGMLILDLLFLKHLLKPFQAAIATLMAYVIINFIPQQVRLSMCEQWFHIPLLS